MISSEVTQNLFVSGSSKILLVVIDGLGGLPHPDTGLSELQRAKLPNLDRLASASSLGTLSPLGPGLTSGSGPGHLALFGYDPWKYQIGRGALSALGMGLDFRPGDVAARLNFCTVDQDGVVMDRRAGRIPTDKCAELCELLNQVQIADVETVVTPEMDYRAVVLFRGQGLDNRITDSDPQVTGVTQRPLETRAPDGAHMLNVANEFLRQAAGLLADQVPANMVLIRGFGEYPELPTVREVYGMSALALAGYPMYRGVAAAVGMDMIETDSDLVSELTVLKSKFDSYDMHYLHYKETDSAGEDGDFELKVRLLEKFDHFVPDLLALNPDVLIVTGDHSTPSIMKRHSWHPVPVLISSQWGMANEEAAFTEADCLRGSLGNAPSTALMALALAHAGRLDKFGP